MFSSQLVDSEMVWLRKLFFKTKSENLFNTSKGGFSPKKRGRGRWFFIWIFFPKKSIFFSENGRGDRPNRPLLLAGSVTEYKKVREFERLLSDAYSHATANTTVNSVTFVVTASFGISYVSVAYFSCVLARPMPMPSAVFYFLSSAEIFVYENYYRHTCTYVFLCRRCPFIFLRRNTSSIFYVFLLFTTCVFASSYNIIVYAAVVYGVLITITTTWYASHRIICVRSSVDRNTFIVRCLRWYFVLKSGFWLLFHFTVPKVIRS